MPFPRFLQCLKQLQIPFETLYHKHHLSEYHTRAKSEILEKENQQRSLSFLKKKKLKIKAPLPQLREMQQNMAKLSLLKTRSHHLIEA